MKPLKNKILVRAFKEDAESTGGIIMPDSYRKDGCKVEILAVGDGSKSKPMLLKEKMIGYRVKDWGIPVQDKGETLYIMEDTAILAIEN